MSAQLSPSPTRLSRLPSVRERTGLPRSSIYALMARGEFPRPINLGGRSVAWLEDDIGRWIDARVAASRRPGPPAKALA
jgi:prophage regulatory protein